MVGITRFSIKNNLVGPGAHRFADSKRYWTYANKLYRAIFADSGTPLLLGEEVIECTKEEFEAGYDYQLGIDLILRGSELGEATMQEKFLFTGFNTITIEHCQDWLTLEPGDWFKLKSQYYFVGYDEQQLTGSLTPWVLCDLARLRRATGQRRIPWKLRGDYTERARASFMYCEFEKLPPDVLAASSERSYPMF